MELSITTIWLCAGVLFLAAEALGVSGIGLLFAGLGALCVGGLLSMDWLDAQGSVLQAVLFFAASAAWAVALWKPLQKFRIGKSSPGYSNMIGETAYVGSSGISKTHGGEVTWSGTIMKAQLEASVSTEKLEAGSQVTITAVKGATLIVIPKI